MTTRIVIADDHPLMRAAIRSSVERIWPGHPVIEVASASEALAAMEAGPVELVTLDLHMADSAGLSPLLELRKRFPAVPVVVISASEDRRLEAGARELGASGFIPKSASMPDMLAALEAVSLGELVFADDLDDGGADDAALLARLTPAQTRILRYLGEGLLNKQIAHEMQISEATVKAHVTAIFRRLGVVNRTQAVLVAQRLDAQPPAV